MVIIMNRPTDRDGADAPKPRTQDFSGHIEEASWIEAPSAWETPRITRRFSVKEKIVAACFEISGLGFFEVYLNGVRVGEDYFVPAVSDYCARDLSRLLYPLHDTFSHRTYYLRYDVGALVQKGENTMEIVLGNGWFRQRARNVEGDMWFADALRAIYALTLKHAQGETVVLSDGSEWCSETEIERCELFLGERHDFTKLPFLTRERVRVISMDTQLTEQKCPTDRVMRTVRAVQIGETDGMRMYDCGEVVSGWARLTVNATTPACLTVTYSEEIDADGHLDPTSTGAAYRCANGEAQIQQDVFVTDGKRRVLAPRFCWHAFRYFTIACDHMTCLDDVCVDVVHSNVALTATFESDHEALNWLYEAYLRTQLDNMHGSIPSDCPHRERLGYTGDGQLTCDAAMLLMDAASFYEKWITDIIDGQDKGSGHVQHTAPFMGGGGGPCGWGGAVVEVPYQYYRHYGGTDKLLLWYPAMRNYVRYILSRSEGDLVVREEDGGWCLGDWASMDEMRLPPPYVNSCLFLRQLREMTEIADLLGLPGDVAQYRDCFARTQKAILKTYYHEESGSFCDGTQGADAFALDVDIAPDARTLDNLSAYYERLGYFDTGFIGTDVLIDVLLRGGKGDLAYRLLTGESMGGYLWMKRQGATTLYEYLNGNGSHCHPMFGAPVKYLFRHFLGICKHVIIDQGNVKETLRIAPTVPAAARSMSGSIATAHGDVSVAWRKEDGVTEINVDIPTGLRAVFAYGALETELHPGETTFVFRESSI